MAKEVKKTNALGLNLDPESFQKALEKEKQKTEETPVEVSAEVPANLLAGLRVEKPAKKSYAFYLSDANVQKLKALADKEGVNASKLLDHILSEVLI